MLVGGFGTRLHPLTLTTPKQMLPVAGAPMIEHVVAGLVRHGVDRVVLSLGYRDDAFRSAYPDGRCAGAEIVCAVEPEPLGTAGAIRFAWQAAGRSDEAFVAVNGDVITDLDVSMLVEHHRRAGAEATIHLIPVADPSRYGVVVTDDSGRVSHFLEKPPAGEAPSRWVNAGSYVMEPSVIDRIPAHGPASVERETFPALVTAGTLHAVQSDVYWVDAGMPASYLQVQIDLLEGRRESPIGGDAPFAAADARTAEGARVERSVVMSGASVGIGARVERSVVMSDANVGAFSVLEDSVLGPSASVGPGSTVSERSIIGADASIGAGEQLRGVRFPELR